MDEFYDDCSIVAAGSTSSGTPTSLSGLANLGYAVPTDRLTYLQLLVYAGADGWKDLGPHVLMETLTISDKARLEISTLKCTIEDMARVSNLPVKLVPRMWIQALNKDASKLYFKGYLLPPKPDPILQRADMTERRYLQLNANDETDLMRRVAIQEVIEATTEGGMIADLGGRWVPELDWSGVDPTLGASIDKKIIDRKFLFQLLQEFLDLNPDTTFWLERKAWPAKTKIWLQKRGSVNALLSTTITDTNVYQYFNNGTFSAAKSVKAYKNRLVLQFHQLYNQGTVNVSNGDVIVYGFGTDWAGKIFAGDTFRLPGSDNTYTVDHINTGVGPVVQEIYLTSASEDATVTGSAYEVHKNRVDEVVAEDLSEIEALKTLNAEIGEYGGVREVVIPPGPNPLLLSEAQRLVNMLLRFNLYEGGGLSNSVLFPEDGLGAGRTLRIDRPLIDIQDDLVIQELVRKGSSKRPASFVGTSRANDPYWVYQFKLTDRLFSEESRFESLLLALRRPKIKDSTTLQIDKTIPEKAWMTDCVGVSEGENVDELAYVADDVGGVVVDTVGPWYASPTVGAHKAMRAVGPGGGFFRAS